MSLQKIKTLSIITATTCFIHTALANTSQHNLSPIWAGSYIGADLAAGFATTGYTAAQRFGSTGPFDKFAFATFTQDSQGVIGGIEAGHDWQRHRWVLGVETRFDGSDLSTTTSNEFDATSPVVFNANVQTKTNYSWLYTLTPRVGFACHNFLFFGKTGLGITHAKMDIDAPTAGNAQASSFSQTQNLLGWDIGGGMEYALHQWRLGVEYDYINFGSNDFGGKGTAEGTDTANSLSTSLNIIALTAGYHFNA